MPGEIPDQDSLPHLDRETAIDLLMLARRQKTRPSLLEYLEEHRVDAGWHDLFKDHKQQQRLELVTMARLRSFAQSLSDSLGEPCFAVVKGPAFAQHVYPSPKFRPFTDIDVLIAPDAKKKIISALGELGFDRHEPDQKTEDHPEMQFLHREFPNLLIETHTDVVHSKRLRETFSLTFADIASAPTAPSTHLLVALAHGFVVNQYYQTGQIVDVVLAARKIVEQADEMRLEAFAAKPGHRPWMCCGLMVAGLLLKDERCMELSRALGTARWCKLFARLIERQLVPAHITGYEAQRRTRMFVRTAVMQQAGPFFSLIPGARMQLQSTRD
ncbi:MAG: nucleotidyltransferase family protein [Pseudomonadota bacterium]